MQSAQLIHALPFAAGIAAACHWMRANDPSSFHACVTSQARHPCFSCSRTAAASSQACRGSCKGEAAEHQQTSSAGAKATDPKAVAAEADDGRQERQRRCQARQSSGCRATPEVACRAAGCSSKAGKGQPRQGRHSKGQRSNGGGRHSSSVSGGGSRARCRSSRRRRSNAGGR